MHTVRNNGSRTGASARANRNAGLLGIVDEVPHNQVVVHIPHSADDADFIFQPLLVFLRRVGVTLPEAVVAQLPEIILVGKALRHREGGQVVLVKYEIQVALLRNFYGIVKGLVAPRKQLPQLRLAFQEKVIGVEAHSVLVVHRFACLDAQEHILHFGILPAQIVGIVGDHQRQPGFSGQAVDALVYHSLLRNAMVLKL